MLVVATLLHVGIDLPAREFDTYAMSHFRHLVPTVLFMAALLLVARRYGTVGLVSAGAAFLVLVIPCAAVTSSVAAGTVKVLELLLMIAVALVFSREVDYRRILAGHLDTEQGLREAAQARLAMVVDADPRAVIMLGEDGRVVRANRIAELLFGVLANGSRSVRELLPQQLAAQLDRPGGDSDTSPVPVRLAAGERWLRPIVTSLNGGLRQVVFIDETDERERNLLLVKYSAEVVRAQEDERARISRELHDDGLQSLEQVARDIEELKQAPFLNSISVAGELGEIRRELGRTIRSLRDLASGLRPPFLDELGLAAALEALAAQVSESNKIDVGFCADRNLPRMGADEELAIYRIAQEALSNVVRHSHAKRALVSLRNRPDAIELRVCDGGSGFANPRTRKAAGKTGLGIVGMNERARMLGGSVKVRSLQGLGTAIVVSIPHGRRAGDSG